MLKESDMVYKALRDSIIHCEDGMRSSRHCMYSVYFIMVTFAFQQRWVFLLSFLVLISFQSMINSGHLAVERMSTYIRIFFESKRDDIHWERLNKDPKHTAVYQTTCRDFGWFINTASSSLLAGASLIGMVIATVETYGSNYRAFPPDAWVGMCTALLLFFLVLCVNKKIYLNRDSSESKDKATIAIIDMNLEEFYQRCADNIKEEQGAGMKS